MVSKTRAWGAVAIAWAVAAGCGGGPAPGEEDAGGVQPDAYSDVDSGGIPEDDGGGGGEVDAYDPDPNVDPPRPIAPMPTATVTTPRPTLTWALAARSDGANV